MNDSTDHQSREPAQADSGHQNRERARADCSSSHDKIDLSASYLNQRLRSPIVASSSPLCRSLDSLRQMEAAGVGAIVLHSLFEEQIERESQWLDCFLNAGTESYAEATSYFPDQPEFEMGPGGYLKHIEQAKKTVGVPIIGSLNGTSTSGWIRYAREIESAGADALELNIYYLPTNPQVASSEVEKEYVDLVRYVKDQVKIPVAVKLPPYFSSTAHVAKQLEAAGADAIVLFNRFYQPDFDLDSMEVVPNLTLSTPDELRLRLHWVALLYPYISPQLAITGGVHSAEDVVKGVMAGAHVVMLTSALLQHGIPYLETLEADLRCWMDRHGYQSITQMRGSMSAANVINPSAFIRANYLKVLSSYALHA